MPPADGRVSRRAMSCRFGSGRAQGGPWLAMFSPMKTNPASVGSGDSSGRNEAPLRTVQLVVDPHSSKTRAVPAALRRYLAFRGAGGCDGVIVVVHTIRGFRGRGLRDSRQIRWHTDPLGSLGNGKGRSFLALQPTAPDPTQTFPAPTTDDRPRTGIGRVAWPNDTRLVHSAGFSERARRPPSHHVYRAPNAPRTPLRLSSPEPTANS
jgi:hypothetical protein